MGQTQLTFDRGCDRGRLNQILVKANFVEFGRLLAGVEYV